MTRTSVVPYVVSFEMVPLPDDVLRPACVLEHIEGETLESMMGDADAAAVTARYGSLELFKLALFRRVVSAVEELHAAGYVHNDLKPGNILIVDDGEGRLPYVRLIDLYSVLKIGAGQMPEKMNWTPGYAASEDLQPGCDEVRPARDIMKLGGLLYWLHTDRSPFHSTIVGLNKIPKEGRNAEILRRLRKSMQDESPFKDPPEDVRKRLEETSAYTAGVICKCMKMDPSERYQDCTELLAAVDRAMEYVALTRVFEDALGFESTRDSYPGHPVTPVPVVEDDGLGRLLMDTLDKAGR
jgi:serine/threonine protein kinase